MVVGFKVQESSELPTRKSTSRHPPGLGEASGRACAAVLTKTRYFFWSASRTAAPPGN